MASRRKQIRPIKASCHDSDLDSNKIPSEDPKLEPVLHIPDSSEFSDPQFVDLKEEHVINLNDQIETENKRNFLPVEHEIIKEISEKNNLNTYREENFEEISKKMNKDEAKILPFQSTGGVDFFKCPLCDQSHICGRESLTIHLQEHQNKMKRDDGKHLCCLCSKELSSNSSLERHLLTHSNHRPFSCYMCDKKFTTNGNLSRHVKTSHNNNETIESSIDEVLKKHQSDHDKTAETIPSELRPVKYRKQIKTSKKDLGSVGKVKPENKLNETLSQLCLGIESQCASEPIFKTILPANLNFFPPLLSLNINDFSFLKSTQSDNLNIFPSNTLPFIANDIKRSPDTAINECSPKTKILKYEHLKSVLPSSQRKRKIFLRKIEMHINRIRKRNRDTLESNIQCRKCFKIFFTINNIISHIKKCYSENRKELKYCMFKMCFRKFCTTRKLINHIKTDHFLSSASTDPQTSPIDEPLNLSLKASQKSNSIGTSSESPNNQIKRSFSAENLKLNEIILNLNHPSLIETSNGILDFSGTNNISWNLQNSIIPNKPIENTPFKCFTSTNQFISSAPFFNSSPISLSNSFKTDWCNINKLEFNENSIIHLDAKSDINAQINNLSLRNSLNSNSGISSISCTGLETMSRKSSITDFSSSSSLSENTKLKYSMAIKKKNSYKDAPKLITCPMEGCVQKFPWNSSLMRHILTHTAHKPFKCTRCIKCFSTKSNRERHMTRVHGVRINRSKFKSLQAAKVNLEDSLKPCEETADSENGNLMDETVFPNDKDINITELSEEEWIIMDNNDRRAEDISNNLLKLAGQPLVEPNPVRLNNNQIPILDKSISPKSEYSTKLLHANSIDHLF